MATRSRSHGSVDDGGNDHDGRNDHARLAFRPPPHLERPRPSDPGADEDVPSERESDTGRESDDRRGPADEPTRDLASSNG